MSSFLYGIKQGIKNVFRNRLFSLASIGTITACLFIFGIFYCMVMNFQHIFLLLSFFTSFPKKQTKHQK